VNHTYKYCRSLCDAAFEIAESMDLNVSIVATDLGGHPIVTLRGDRTTYASMEAARRKAVAASGMQMSTSALSEMFAQDPLVQLAVHASGEMLVVPGGFPIIFGSGCIGGLGIAGGHYKEDHVVGEKAFIKLMDSSRPAGN
jgi:glc operon protein GlcG